jgi:transcription-repair coupling factor (superfamily II helicase)
MYLKLLEEAVLEERGEKPPVETECAADFAVAAHIPDRYAPSPEQRMDLYRRIAKLRTEEEADDMVDELIDRFGDPPRPVNNLISVALLRGKAAQCGISEISQKGMALNLSLKEFDLKRISHLCALERYKGRLLFSAGEKPYLSLRLKNGEDALKSGERLVADYAAPPEE